MEYNLLVARCRACGHACSIGDELEENVQAFETSEYRARIDRVRELMAEARIDSLLVLSEANLCYLTGYEGFSSYVPQAALITLEDDPYLILRGIDITCADATSWLPSDHLVPYPEIYIGGDRSPWEAIGTFVKDQVASSRIGAEFSSVKRAELGVKEYAKLIEALGVEQLQDASGLVSVCKRVKSEQELAYMTEAAAIVDRAMLAGIAKIAVGTRQCDVAATMMAALCAGTESIPGGPPLNTPTMPVGEMANAPHLKWTDQTYTAGQQTNIEIGAFRRRYCCALSRTAYLGSPPSRLKDIHYGVLDGFQTAVDNIRPGVTCSDVTREFGIAFKRHGIKKESRIGYSLGIDWTDGGASLGENNHTEILANMTFHVIVGVFERDEGYVFSETVRVGDNGAETLSNVPRVLFECPA